MYNVIQIDATTVPDAWFQTIYKCIETGRDFRIDRGSYQGDTRLEFDFITVNIKCPDGGEVGNFSNLVPIMPESSNIQPPFDLNYLNDYVPYLMSDKEPATDEEAYTYGQRICGARFNSEYLKSLKPMLDQKEIEELMDLKIIKPFNYCVAKEIVVNQMELIIWTYKNKGYRNNQMCISVAQPSDVLLKDPPCLRLIDTRIQDGYLHFFPYFRSWDLYGGFPANLAAIEVMKQYMAESIGVKNGRIVASSKGLHIYSYVVEFAEMLRGKTLQECRSLMKGIEE